MRIRSWLWWAAVNLLILGGAMVGGALLLVPAAVAGWGDADARHITYILMAIYVPFTGPVYLCALAFVAPRVKRPRLWAVALTLLMWVPVPILAAAVWIPGILAIWIAYLTFGLMVRLPPPADLQR